MAGEEEIWSTVAHSRPNIVFKTMELVLSLVSFLSLDVFKQAGYIYICQLSWRKSLFWVEMQILLRKVTYNY